jgi:hypothetical protein
LLGVEKGVIGEEVDGLCVIQLQLLLDYHDQLEDCEALQDEDSIIGARSTCCYRIPSVCSASRGWGEWEFYRGGTCGSFPPLCDDLSLTLLWYIYKLSRALTHKAKKRIAKLRLPSTLILKASLIQSNYQKDKRCE